MESKASMTTTKSDYEQQLEELWKESSQQKEETDQCQGQMHKQPEGGGGEREMGGGDGSSTLQGLPLESSPYVKYSDLEDYKRKAYGTQGHLEPKPHPHIGTDAPTLDGSRAADEHHDRK